MGIGSDHGRRDGAFGDLLWELPAFVHAVERSFRGFARTGTVVAVNDRPGHAPFLVVGMDRAIREARHDPGVVRRTEVGAQELVFRDECI